MIDADADDISPMSDEERAQRLARMKARVEASLADPRPPIPLEEAFRRLRASLKKPDDEAA